MGFFKKLFSKNDEQNSMNQIFSPVAGQAVPLAAVPDITFSEGLLGSGVAIVPDDGKVCAPCNATVDMVFTTGHAVTLVADNGAEILIHVGLETVELRGKYFTIHVKNGQSVKKGQLMIEVDLDGIKAAGLNTITPVLVCNCDDFAAFCVNTGKSVSTSDVIITLNK